jgi:hypothetical protein
MGVSSHVTTCPGTCDRLCSLCPLRGGLPCRHMSPYLRLPPVLSRVPRFVAGFLISTPCRVSSFNATCPRICGRPPYLRCPVARAPVLPRVPRPMVGLHKLARCLCSDSAFPHTSEQVGALILTISDCSTTTIGMVYVLQHDDTMQCMYQQC